ncbi:ABC transporter ATP-binding protein [Bdellovibrio sp. KM01]|uniref:ABC transporter ATP-binding protein n=1 Tax=Bdellovibrio sp. KM01 TaxID=2748865 RepID=UPI0015EA3D7E|nr:ATP-binding cassette domain-containing protein [Bdellovibrio sp. KM01]QLY26933.1 ATP-binding cassette domain-containing protein [Bdellovibrio sp. KM01]
MEIRLQNIITPFFKLPELTIASHERVLIKGPSGTGKTTLLHLLAGLYTPHFGEIFWDGESLAKLSESKISQLRKENMSLIFQNLNLLPYLTATENLELVGLNKNAALEMLSAVGLKDKSFSRTQSMSLGEQQRIAVARALGLKPANILADEPTSSLDDKNAEQVMKLLIEGSHHPSVIMVSHDHRVEKYFTRILDMREIVK